MKTKAQLSGFAELEKALGNLPEAVGKRITRAAMKQAAEPMAEAARELAPEKTGKLKKSIKIGSMLNGRQRKIRKRSLTADEKNALTLFMGPSYLKGDYGRHGHLVEFGTRPHKNGGQFAGTDHPGTAPQPFMRPAFDREAMPTVERLKPLLYKAIEKAAKREAAKARKQKG